MDELIELYRCKKVLFNYFLDNVEVAFKTCHALNSRIPTPIHSIKRRLKDENHLRGKIERKVAAGHEITPENIFSEITDLAGIRIIHLYQGQFEEIHNFIVSKIKKKTWKLVEKPVAYTWDPESESYFRSFKISTKLKPSFYTSVHYLISPQNEDKDIVCEIQVRTLFEEAWGEIDHSINYPSKTSDLANREQLRVLSKLVSTGSRLAESIFKVHNSQETEEK
ncbi:RelA/SpoT domain-containing protein [Xanthomonas axonopodis pv. ricini]|uniref:RelA/SpoT domain-containing protein n=1 Tax=Xanthomonas euvesicatoria TaxID=456327 RepID=UPI0024566639|nr:RelA/SpoT domain-containing protein [Xanthomonas euvesicatoria]MDH4906144.1 RelA/SpoT domain-containing protein [Xanthomonas euvesicatoria]